jgi:hypothetical protein
MAPGNKLEIAGTPSLASAYYCIKFKIRLPVSVWKPSGLGLGVQTAVPKTKQTNKKSEVIKHSELLAWHFAESIDQIVENWDLTNT